MGSNLNRKIIFVKIGSSNRRWRVIHKFIGVAGAVRALTVVQNLK